MTDLLPKGFGSTSFEEDGTPSKEKLKKCRLGKVCGNGTKSYDTQICSIHKWTNYHDDAWNLIRIIGILTLAVIITVGIVGFYQGLEKAAINEYSNIIESFDCYALAEEVADHKKYTWYAEHRYKWLCVEAVQHNLES